jgi:hypothetical protein
MLVSTIISNALSKADVSNQNFYSASDQLFDVQIAWEKIYAFLCENDDDYFCTSLYIPSSSFTADANRTHMYLYSLPADFFRLRLFSYLGNTGNLFYSPCQKMDTLNFGNTQNAPAYRLMGSNLELYDPYGYTTYNLWYYPSPLSALGIASGQPLLTTTNISTPNNMLPEYMVWEVAADIRRKQNQDPALQQAKADGIMLTMKKQSNRDDFRVQHTKDLFDDGLSYWV